MHEWPLLIFTLLLQGAVGMMLFMTLALCPKIMPGFTDKQALLPVFAVCVMAGAGLLASVFHLGYPLNAFNALRHIASSWLSREIVFASLFLAAAGLSLLALLFKRSMWKALTPLALLLGLIDVYCMSKIYMQSSVVTWMHANTLVMFYGSVGIVGAVAASLLLSQKTPALLCRMSVIVVTVVVIRLLMQMPYMSWLAEAAQNDALTFPHQPLAAFRSLADLRLVGWACSVLGTAAFVFGAARHRRAGMLIGGMLLLIAEIVLRYAFFSIH